MAVRIKINHAGIRALLNSPEAAQLVRAEAAKVLARAGDGFGMKMEKQGDRPSAIVYTDTFRARYHQAREHLLEQAIGSR
jgi:hypothetical protein